MAAGHNTRQRRCPDKIHTWEATTRWLPRDWAPNGCGREQMNTFSPALWRLPLCARLLISSGAKKPPPTGLLAFWPRALASLGIAQSSAQAQALVPCRFPPASIVLEHFATKQSPSPSETETGIHAHKLYTATVAETQKRRWFS